MTNHLVRNGVCLLLLIGLACGITGLYEQREAIKAQSRPDWVIVGGK